MEVGGGDEEGGDLGRDGGWSFDVVEKGCEVWEGRGMEKIWMTCL